jgi:hypothetical protein
MTSIIKTLRINDLYETLSISDNQYNWQSALMTVALVTVSKNDIHHNNALTLCRVSLFWESLYWMSLYWVSLYWDSLNTECRYAECRYAECRGPIRFAELKKFVNSFDNTNLDPLTSSINERSSQKVWRIPPQNCFSSRTFHRRML